jgi:alpha-ketoglutarate-dependent 2,4-dichlorophenoxyacetate dioxygenase
VVNEIAAHFRGLDIIVNNAGISVRVAIDDPGYDAAWSKALAVMLTAHPRIVRAALPRLRKSKCPRIVNIASTEALGATALHSAYSAAKGGVASLTRSLAVELGREGITVNCICPGPIRTAITDRISEEHKTIYARRRTALGRYGDPEEVAHMTLSLCLVPDRRGHPGGRRVDGAQCVRQACPGGVDLGRCRSSLAGKSGGKTAARTSGEDAMAIAIRQIHKHFVGEVSGVDLRTPLTKDEAAAIEAGMDKYAVLVFHGQNITDDQQMAFALNFGQRENPRGGNITKKQDYRLGSAGLNDVSNLDKDGKPFAKDHRTHLFNLGNCLWHSDSSFRAIPAKFSLLSARVVNPKGGNTEFADMRAAYDALDDETKADIEEKICEHSLMYSRGSLGFLDYTDEEKELFKPVLQRLVRTHPVHKRKSLYLSSHAGKVQGMSMPEGRLLLRDLTEHATQPEFVYVHKWTLHDLVMWDNRQTMHRVRRYDQSQPRDMRRATVAGTVPTVPQEAAERQLAAQQAAE